MGNVVRADGRVKPTVEHRVQKANRAFGAMEKYLFGNKKVRTKDKMRCIEGAIEPSLMFGCENWALDKESERRLNVCQMRWLRKCLGLSVLSKVRNQEIRRRCGTEAMATKVARRQLRYYGHVVSMDSSRLVKRVSQWRAPGSWKRPRGRRRATWEDTVLRNARRVGMRTREEVDQAALDRLGWRNAIRDLKDWV